MYKKDLKICNGLIYLEDKTRYFTYFKYVCIYLFAIHKKLLKIVNSLILRETNYIFTKRITLYSEMRTKQPLV